jgi:sterol desaturase/sphingolipid hydroxylase (fatty acid hydroxylase superfamily)
MGPETALVLSLATWTDAAVWEWYHFALFAGIITAGWELMSYLVSNVPEAVPGMEKIKVRGKHLDRFENVDMAYIAFNRCVSILFVYHMVQFVAGGGRGSGHIEWDMNKLTAGNTVAPLFALYLVYDFFYCFFHMALHQRSIYAYVHKHHHRQKAPSRGNSDAINVHPFEFITGEYLHLLSVWIVPCHVVTVAVFVALGGILASLNHTRFDIKLPWGSIYSVKFHDHHHVVPNTNYSQYTMFWDHVAGSFRDHPDSLDEKTATLKSE